MAPSEVAESIRQSVHRPWRCFYLFWRLIEATTSSRRIASFDPPSDSWIQAEKFVRHVIARIFFCIFPCNRQNQGKEYVGLLHVQSHVKIRDISKLAQLQVVWSVLVWNPKASGSQTVRLARGPCGPTRGLLRVRSVFSCPFPDRRQRPR